jgi:restriction system protein
LRNYIHCVGARGGPLIVERGSAVETPALILAVLALLVGAWILRSPWLKGAVGELKVRTILRPLLNARDYQLFSDLILPTRNGTTQVDHVVVSRFGVFVIETKNMSGWIFGTENQPTWTQVVYRRKSQFQNPIRQNYKHVRAVQEVLGIDGNRLHSIVAFVGSATPKSETSLGVVWGVRSLAAYIKSKRIAVFDEHELRAISARLADPRFRSSTLARRDHVRSIKSQVANRHQDLSKCPRCGATLVERSNRASGTRFLACSRYPKCRGTRALS